MRIEELEEFVRVHHSAIAHHEQWLTEQAEAKARHDSQLEQWRIQQAEAEARHDREIEAIRALQNFNAQQLNSLTAGLLELRYLVADYLQGRSR